MPLKTPKFWQSGNMLAFALLPASAVYYAAHKVKTLTASTYDSRLPVLCVGGVVAGGSGKTPTVHALLKLVKENNIFERPVVVTRGYGGALQGPTLVDLEFHSAKDVGDEALLHATYGATIVSRDRVAGAKLAEAMDADVIILDDGLQNPSLKKDLCFLVIDGRNNVGNGLLLPAGPLREPLSDAAAKCAAVVETNGKSGLEYGRPVLSSDIRITSDHDLSQKYHAFCGLGHPAKFFDMLDFFDFTIQGYTPYADHHPYTPQDMEDLLDTAKDARLLTTEKDYVRVPDSYKSKVDVVSIELEFDEPDKVVALIKDGLPK